VRHDDWRRYVAPAAFLLAATLAVVLIRSGLESGHTGATTPTATAPTTTRKHVATTTTTKTTRKPKPKAGAAQYWTVQAGDTFGVISSKSGVPVATIEQLNPNVSSTSLFIGEKIRIK
jgi:LysM repeat protein